MKRLLILILVACLGVLIWLLLPRKGATTAGAPSPVSAGQPAATAKAPINKPSTATSTISGMLLGKYPRWEGGRSIGLNDPRWEVVRAREKVDRAWQGKMPIDFFGKVVDLEDRPVEGATVRFSWTDLSAAGSTQTTTMSDARGLFSLNNATGKSLGVLLEKEGYYTSKLNRYGFEFASFSAEDFYQPDPSNPVVFHLRKKEQAEALSHRQTLYGLRIDGTPQYIEFRSGKKTTGGDPQGDLGLSLVRKASGGPSHYDWTLVLSSVGAGGIEESKEEFMFLAPEANYGKSIVIDQKGGDANYESQVKRNYYVRLSDGRTYARISTVIRPKYNEGGAIDIELFLNPSGSRNLEYDAAKVVK
jgi:hypothetical protein